ncbi:MAG: TIGR04053 family radical SAM/SPASM domain-containing protein [Acidobacteriota bacterium]
MKDFSASPFLVIWEVTQACRLACIHCRASAQPCRHPLELTTDEGKKLLESVSLFGGNPLMVLTGGDPLERPDLGILLRHSIQLGLRTTVTPSATPLLTAEALHQFKEIGVARMAISLDGPDRESHDGFRKVEGSFERTLFALGHARQIGLATQVNTTVTRHNWTRLPEIAQLVEASGAKLWSLFFLVTTGRANAADDLTAGEYEQVFGFLYQLSLRAPFDIKTTEAQHYRRYVAQQRKQQTSGPRPVSQPASDVIARQAGINDGKGLVFVSHTGEVFPSGFLPVSAGNVRRCSLVDIYRNSPPFLQLRNSARLKGKCGACEFRNLCGGSRSRAYAFSGDYLFEDPRCAYQPASLTR